MSYTDQQHAQLCVAIRQIDGVNLRRIVCSRLFPVICGWGCLSSSDDFKLQCGVGPQEEPENPSTVPRRTPYNRQRQRAIYNMEAYEDFRDNNWIPIPVEVYYVREEGRLLGAERARATLVTPNFAYQGDGRWLQSSEEGQIWTVCNPPSVDEWDGGDIVFTSPTAGGARFTYDPSLLGTIPVRTFGLFQETTVDDRATR